MHVNQTSILLQTVLQLMNFHNERNETTVVQPTEAVEVDHGTLKCYDQYGCFSIEEPWPRNRPVNLFPEPPEKVNAKFCLYTQHELDSCQRLSVTNTSTFFKSSIKGSERTFFIIHGYLESANKTWMKNMVRELLKAERRANVITVDWQGGSGPPYAQAVANIRLVGRIVALLIYKLAMEVGVNPEKCHIIGHSLGSHTAGYAGSRLFSEWGYRLGRITGMDPAEPHFADTDPEVRLDPTDALYVDVIHTDAASFITGGFGIKQAVGHVDFYPNGGEVQPGCDTRMLETISQDKGSFIRGLQRAVGCNHIRSHEFFTESINSKCEFLAVECESWEKFESGDCFSCPEAVYYNTKPTCTRFGLHSRPTPPRNNVQLFLKTAASPPFCRHHYRMEIKISNSSRSFEHGGEVGEFWVELHGASGDASERIRLQDGVSYFEPGSQRRRVVPGSKVNQLDSATIEWQYHTTLWNPLTWRYFTNTQIYLQWLRIDVLETKESLFLCTGGEAMRSGQPITFTKAKHSCNRQSHHPPKQ